MNNTDVRCTECEQVFTNKHSLQHHTKAIHQTTCKVSRDGSEWTVMKLNEKWQCPCCTVQTETANGLQKHFKSCLAMPNVALEKMREAIPSRDLPFNQQSTSQCTLKLTEFAKSLEPFRAEMAKLFGRTADYGNLCAGILGVKGDQPFRTLHLILAALLRFDCRERLMKLADSTRRAMLSSTSEKKMIVDIVIDRTYNQYALVQLRFLLFSLALLVDAVDIPLKKNESIAHTIRQASESLKSLAHQILTLLQKIHVDIPRTAAEPSLNKYADTVAAHSTHLHKLITEFTTGIFESHVSPLQARAAGLPALFLYVQCLTEEGEIPVQSSITQDASALNKVFFASVAASIFSTQAITVDQQIELVDGHIQSYQSSHSAFNEMNLFASLIKKNIEPKDANITWEASLDYGILNGFRFSKIGLLNTVAIILDRLEKMLHKDLLLGLIEPSSVLLDSAQIQINQDIGLHRANANIFNTHPLLSPLLTSFISVLASKANNTQPTAKAAGPVCFGSPDIAKLLQTVTDINAYFTNVKIFIYLLLAAVHLTGGMPWRMASYTSLTFADETSRNSSIFAYNGQIMLQCSYSKGNTWKQTHTRQIKLLPWKLSKIVFVYLAVVRRVEVCLLDQTKLDKIAVAMTTLFSHRGDYCTDRQCCDNIRALWLDSYNHPNSADPKPEYGVRDIRHLLIGFARRLPQWWRTYKAQVEIEENSVHGLKRRSVSFFLDADEADNASDDDDSPEEGQPRESLGTILARQAQHSVRIDNAEYARSNYSLHGVSDVEREQFVLASKVWHAFIGLDQIPPSAQHTSSGLNLKRNTNSLEPPPSSCKKLLFSKDDDIDIQKSLCSLLQDPSAKFTSVEQAACVQKILQRNENILFISPTGSGKTLVAQLAAFIDTEGVYVYIAPPTLLLQTLQERFTQLGIKSITYTSRLNAATVIRDNYRVVFAHPLAGEQAHWFKQNVLIPLFQQKSLRYIIVDEAHLVIDWDFRQDVNILWKLRSGILENVPLLLMTATAPPSLVQNLLSRYNCPVSTTTVIRNRQVRTNIQYKVEIFEDGSDDDERAALKHAYSWVTSEKRAANERIMIICAYVEQCRKMATKLQLYLKLPRVPCIVGEMALDAKSEAWNYFISEGPVICGTSAIGLGMDYGHISKIVIVGGLTGLNDLAQFAGRIGRAGDPSECIVFHKVSNTINNLYTAWAASSTGNICLRLQLHNYLNGPADGDGTVNRSGTPECFCTVCCAKPSMTGGIGNDEALFAAALHSTLNLLEQPFCALCFVFKRPWTHDPGHTCQSNSRICRVCYSHQIGSNSVCGNNKPDWRFTSNISVCYRCVTPRTPTNGFVFCRESCSSSRTCPHRDVIKDLNLVLLNYQFPANSNLAVSNSTWRQFIGVRSTATSQEVIDRLSMTHPRLRSFPVATIAAYFIVVTTLELRNSVCISEFAIVEGTKSSSASTVNNTNNSNNNNNNAKSFPKECYRCKSNSHFAKDCPEKNRCFKCKEVGHWSAQCGKK